MPDSNAADRRQRTRLVLGIAALGLALVLVILTILDPVWYGWLSVVSLLFTSVSFLTTYRNNRRTL